MEKFNNGINDVVENSSYEQGPVTSMEPVTFTYIPPITDSSFTSNVYSNLWSYLGYYIEQDGLDKNIPYTEGGVLGSLFNDIPIAFLSGGTIMFQVSNEAYPTQISSTDIRIKIPLTGTTTATTLYSSYVNTPELYKLSNNIGCGGINGDNWVSGDQWSGFAKEGLGYPESQGNNSGVNVEKYTVTNVVALMSDDWEFSGTTTGLTSWSAYYGVPVNKNLSRKYMGLGSGSGARTIEPFPTTSLGISGTSFSDRAAGVFYPVNGIGFLFGDFVTNFDWGSATGGTGTTEVTFPLSHAAFEGRKVDFLTKLTISMVIPQTAANSSMNPTWAEAVNEAGEICGTIPTGLCFSDKNKIPILIAKFDETNLPMKTSEETLVYTFDVPIGSPLTLGTATPYTGVFPCDVGTCP